MSNTTLKIIACVSMLVDHIGYILFPQYIVFRYFGRIAMPIFAFFIGQGCRYTKNKLKYFIQVFLLGVFCQIVSTINDLITGNFTDIYGNILITFSLSIVICFAYLYLENAIKQNNKNEILKRSCLLLICLLGIFCILRFTDNVIGIPFSVDYGWRGVILPLCACVFTKKPHQLILFSIGLIMPMIILQKGLYFTLFSATALIFLCFYNGKYGNRKLKYLFYIFYPTHLAVLHLISLIV